jgi:hypothetical protein
MHWLKTALCLAAACMWIAGTAPAQTADSTQRRLALATEIVDLTAEFDFLSQALKDQGRLMVDVIEQQTGQKLADDVATLVRQLYAEILEERLPTLKKGYAQSYASSLDEEEMRALLDFYHTPVGRRYVAKLPQLLRASASLMESTIPDVMAEFNARLEPRLQELRRKGPGTANP